MIRDRGSVRVLVACEYSGVVRDAFIRAGFDAWSNDLESEAPEGEWPEKHLVGDCLHHIEHSGPWDLLIAHPPCTYLCSSGLHWNTRGVMVDGRPRAELTEDSLEFVRTLLATKVPHIAVENPIGCISTRVRKPDQTVQPHQFGDDASKATCLWTVDLPSLKPTKIVKPLFGCAPCRQKFPVEDGVDGCPKCGGLNGKPKQVWGNQTASGQNALAPGKDRWKDRSRTYQGIADAMAKQWGDYLMGIKPCHSCGYEFDHELLGKYGCPNCEDDL